MVPEGVRHKRVPPLGVAGHTGAQRGYAALGPAQGVPAQRLGPCTASALPAVAPLTGVRGPRETGDARDQAGGRAVVVFRPAGGSPADHLDQGGRDGDVQSVRCCGTTGTQVIRHLIRHVIIHVLGHVLMRSL